MERPIFVANVRVIEPSLRRRADQRVINIRRDVEITINSTIAEFDFESAKLFAVTDRGEGGRLNRRAPDVGHDPDGLGTKHYREEENAR